MKCTRNTLVFALMLPGLTLITTSARAAAPVGGLKTAPASPSLMAAHAPDIYHVLKNSSGQIISERIKNANGIGHETVHYTYGDNGLHTSEKIIFHTGHKKKGTERETGYQTTTPENRTFNKLGEETKKTVITKTFSPSGKLLSQSVGHVKYGYTDGTRSSRSETTTTIFYNMPAVEEKVSDILVDQSSENNSNAPTVAQKVAPTSNTNANNIRSITTTKSSDNFITGVTTLWNKTVTRIEDLFSSPSAHVFESGVVEKGGTVLDTLKRSFNEILAPIVPTKKNDETTGMKEIKTNINESGFLTSKKGKKTTFAGDNLQETKTNTLNLITGETMNMRSGDTPQGIKAIFQPPAEQPHAREDTPQRADNSPPPPENQTPAADANATKEPANTVANAAAQVTAQGAANPAAITQVE